MATPSRYTHAPGADLDYGLTWAAWLAAGETIVSSTWSISGGLTLDGQQIAGPITSTFVSGASVAGNTYTLVNTIVTSEGRADSRSLLLVCAVR